MLVDIISKNAGDEQEPREYYPSPSKVGQCVRNLTYYAAGVPAKPFSDRAMMVFDDGNWHEERIKDMIRGTVYRLHEFKGKKQRIFIAKINGNVLDGEIDGMIEDPLARKRLLEIKTINHFGFERLQADPDPSHKRQANLYLHGLRLAGFTDIDEAVIIYKNKNTAALKEFIIKYDEKQALDDIQMFLQIDEWASKKVVPPRPYDRDKDWQCDYCPRSEFCYKDYEKEFEALSPDAALDDEAATLMKYYLEVSGHRLKMEKEEKELKEKIKSLLKDKDAKGGRAGEYVAKLTLMGKTTMDKTVIPAEILKLAEKEGTYEKLTIRKIKENTK